MIKKTLITLSAFLVVACAKNRGPEELRFDATKDWVSKDALTVNNLKSSSNGPERSVYIFKNTIVKTSSNGGFAFVGLQSDVRMGYFDFTEYNMQFKSLEGIYQGQESTNVVNRVVVQWPATHHDVRLDVSEGRVTNKQIDDDFKKWDQKKYVNVDFNNPSIGEEQTLPYTPAIATSLQCWTLASRERVRDSLVVDPNDGYFSFLVEAVYKQNPLCSGSLSKHHDSDFTYTIQYRYSFRRLEDTTYQPLEFKGGELDPARYKYGYFQTVKAEKDPSTPGGRINRFFVNRWDPNKVHNFYFANGTPEKYKPLFRDIFAQTNKILAKTGKPIRFNINDYNYNHETKKNDGPERQFGDLRYSFINIVDELDPSSPLGYGPSDSNPRTGELLAANTIIWTGSLQYYLTVLDMIARDRGDKYASESLYQKMSAALQMDPSEWKTQWDMKDSRIGQAYQKLVDRTAFNVGYNSYTAFDEDGVSVPAIMLRPADKNAGEQNVSETFLDNIGSVLGDGAATSDLISKLYKKTVDEKGLTSYVQNSFAYTDVFNHPRMASLVNLWKARQGSAQLEVSNMSETVKQTVEHRHLEANMNAKGHCAFPAEAALAGVENIFLDGKTKEEILETIVYRVGIHEFGHNLNLRHNFYGTVDNANFRLHENPETLALMEPMKDDQGQLVKNADGSQVYWPQVSSSVMDYLRLEHEYHSPRTWEDYDRAAIHYAYSGGDEIEKGRTYLFCTDEQTITSALCNRFDLGSTPSEVLMSQIEAYESRYVLSNYRNGRAFWDTSGYASSVFGTMWEVKEFYPLWRSGFAQDIVNNTLSSMGINDSNEQLEVYEQINREMKKVVMLSMAFYQSVIQQSAVDKPYRSVFDEKTGALKRIGIGADKQFAMFFLAGDDSFPYNPNRYMIHQSYLTHMFDSGLATFSQKVWENVVTQRVDNEPWFISYGRALYAISSMNFYNRDSEEFINRIRTYRYDTQLDLQTELGLVLPDDQNAKLYTLETSKNPIFKVGEEVAVIKIDNSYYVVPKSGSPYAYTIAKSVISNLNDGYSTVQNKIDLEELWLLSKLVTGSPL